RITRIRTHFSSFFCSGRGDHRLLPSFPTRRSSDLTVLLLRERPDEAIVIAQRALQVSGYDQPARAYTNIGIAYLKKGALTQAARSEEHTSELQSRFELVCRLLLEKKNKELSHAHSN